EPARRCRRGWSPTAGLAPGYFLLPAGLPRGGAVVSRRRARLLAEYSAGHGILRLRRAPTGPRRSPSSERRRGPPRRGPHARLLPGESVFTRFGVHAFPDLYTPMWVASIALLVVLVVLYNVRTRALHRHAVYLDMWERLLWTGISLFGLILVASVFNFYLIVLLVILITGLAVLLWVRFLHF